MALNAKKEMFDHIELFGKPALFTNFRIDRSTVPENWYCYDFRGSDSDPGKLNYVEPRVGVNHAGAVLLPEELDLKGKDYRRVRGQINFLGSRMTLETFCEVHDLPYPAEEEKYHTGSQRAAAPHGLRSGGEHPNGDHPATDDHGTGGCPATASDT